MNGAYASPLIAPTAFAGRQSMGGSTSCCRLHYYQRVGILMTNFKACQEYLQRRHNAFAGQSRDIAVGKILKLRQKRKREYSFDYLINEKFVQFAEPDEEHLFIICGQSVPLSPSHFLSYRNRHRKNSSVFFCASHNRRSARVLASHAAQRGGISSLP